MILEYEGNTMKILIVDNQAGVRKTLGRILEDEGHSVAVAAEGRNALERALREELDFILYDAHVPDLSGAEFLEEYQRSGGPALVIVMTAYGSNELAVSLMERGAYDYLPKPFTTAEVILVLLKSVVRERRRAK